MKDAPSHPERRARLAQAAPFVLVALTIAFAHFFWTGTFGLYEDDYVFVGKAMTSPGDVQNIALSSLRGWPQGRPLAFALPPVLTGIGLQLGGLPAVYGICFLIQALNGILFYLLCKKCFPVKMALFAALAFCLFPADTSKPLLTHGLILHPSMTCLLVASHLYLSGRRAVPYLIIVASLLLYENAFLPFIGVPLLAHEKWGKRLLISLVKHLAIIAVIVLLVWLVRKGLGEGRVAQVGLRAVRLALLASVIGPVVSTISFAYGPFMCLKAIVQGGIDVALAAGASALILASFFLRKDKNQGVSSRATSEVAGRARSLARPGPIVRGLVVGSALLAVAYLLSFTHFPPTRLAGRLTSMHFAAAVGAGILWGAVCYSFLTFCSARRLRLVGTVIISVHFALLIGYGFVIQNDFRQSWRNQRWFWSAVVAQCPDVTDGTMIFVSRRGLPVTQFIDSNCWADPIILDMMFQFPEHWKKVPRLFVVNADWVDTIVLKNGDLMWKVPTATWWAYWTALPNGNVIFLDVKNGKLVRCVEPLPVGQALLVPKERPAPTTPVFEKRRLFEHLVRKNGTWATLSR